MFITRPLPVLSFHWSNGAHDLQNKTKEPLFKEKSLLRTMKNDCQLKFEPNWPTCVKKNWSTSYEESPSRLSEYLLDS